mmetsp:Transcript_69906/g.158661  ORF Transcript_69906/g.158661 Transcript_69906/m.158661 type:complete len:296 (+) Transcript_69906:53-940(+)
MVADVILPLPLAADILWHYADVLRVGRVRVNGKEVLWNTCDSTREQLRGFSTAFIGALRQLPELSGVEDSVLCEAAYWFCKVVSINYAFSEVLELVKQKVGTMCSIRTCGDAGMSLVDYCVEVQPGCLMRVYITWRGKGNIVHCDPATAKKRVRGTLSQLETVFALPPEAGFAPTYRLRLKLKRSRTSRLLSAVACAVSGKRRSAIEMMALEDPLGKGYPPACGLAPAFSGTSSWSASLDSSDSHTTLESLSEGEADGLDDFDDPALFPEPLHFTPHSVRQPSACPATRDRVACK